MLSYYCRERLVGERARNIMPRPRANRDYNSELPECCEDQ